MCINKGVNLICDAIFVTEIFRYRSYHITSLATAPFIRSTEASQYTTNTRHILKHAVMERKCDKNQNR